MLKWSAWVHYVQERDISRVWYCSHWCTGDWKPWGILHEAWNFLRELLGLAMHYLRKAKRHKTRKQTVSFLCCVLAGSFKQWKTSFEKICFSAWTNTLNKGLINKGWYVCRPWNMVFSWRFEKTAFKQTWTDTVIYVSICNSITLGYKV